MLVTIKGQPQDLSISTVSLIPTNSDALYMFHCTHCGGNVAKYQGSVTKVYPFLEPSDQALVAKSCKQCGQNYTFQTHRGYKHAKTKVILSVDKSGQGSFFCHMGRTLILSYTTERIFDYTTNTTQFMPFFAVCPQENCSIEYYFYDLLH